MAFDLKKDWPIVAAVGAAGVGIVLVSRSRTEQGTQLVRLGGGGADYQAQLQASTALATAGLQARQAALGAVIGGITAHEELETQRFAVAQQANLQREAIQLQHDAEMANIQAQSRAIAGQQANQAQANTLGFIGAVLPAVLGLFCVETTAKGLARRTARNASMREAYAGQIVMQGRA